jgi:hypothetical protein
MRSSARSSGAGRGRVEWNHLLSNGGVKIAYFQWIIVIEEGGESSRPSQHLPNSIRRFSRLQIFHSERRHLPHSERLLLLGSQANERAVCG